MVLLLAFLQLQAPLVSIRGEEAHARRASAPSPMPNIAAANAHRLARPRAFGIKHRPARDDGRSRTGLPSAAPGNLSRMHSASQLRTPELRTRNH